MTIKTYYTLTKPGIIFGNAVTAIGGFALASRGHMHFWLFLATLVGLSLIVGSACVFNNCMDRETDKKMARTRERALAIGLISVKSAMVFGSCLLLAGTALLSAYTNLLTTLIALVGFVVYVFVYSPLKYRSIHGTLIGSVAGAVPPVVGYCAVTNHFDLAAFILFMIVALWQMPHFFAIALYRFNDYAAAAIPVLPIKRGMHATKIQMTLYIIAFILATASLTVFGYTGYVYLTIAGLLGLVWLRLSLKGFKCANDKTWARGMFIFSLVIVTALCGIIPFDVM